MEDSCPGRNDCQRRSELEKIREMIDLYENQKCPYNLRFKIQGCLLLRDQEIEELFELMDLCRDKDKEAPCISRQK
jgi:hypothetical protein